MTLPSHLGLTADHILPTHNCFPPNIYFKRPLSQSWNMTEILADIFDIIRKKLTKKDLKKIN